VQLLQRGGGAKGTHARDSAMNPPMLRRPFERLATARKLLSRDWMQARAARFGACRQQTQSASAMHPSMSSVIRALLRAMFPKRGEAARDRTVAVGYGKEP